MADRRIAPVILPRVADKFKSLTGGVVTRRQITARKQMDWWWRCWLVLHRLMIRDVRAGQRVKFLYRYLRIQEDRDFDRTNLGYLASSVLDGVVYAPVCGQFNDPWEASPAVRFPIGALPQDKAAESEALLKAVEGTTPPEDWAANKRLIQLVGDISEMGRQHSFQDGLRSLYGSLHVLCLSQTPDNQLMWSYYGGGHRGIVLIYDATEMPFVHAARVNYNRYYPVLDQHTTIEKAALLSLVTKVHCWRHEKEWRLIFPAAGMPGVEPAGRVRTSTEVSGTHFRIRDSALVGLILGSGTSDAHEDAVTELIKRRALPLRIGRAEISENQFRIKIRYWMSGST